MNKTYNQHKMNGECVDCGAVLPPRWGYVLCAHCRQKRQEVQNKYKIKAEIKAETEAKAKNEKVIKANVPTLDEMSIEAKQRGISYGQLQTEETVARLRERDRVNMTLRRWGS